MNSAASKLGKLENVQIMEHINGYFNELNRKNRDFVQDGKVNGTASSYEADIRLFFFLMRGKDKGKELEFLSLDDLNITQEDFEEYIEKLCNLKDVKGNNFYVNKTINKKSVALKSFIRYMKRKKVIATDISYLELIKGEKERKVHYGVLSPEETLTMANLCLEERDKKLTKKLLILTAFKTGLRISELLDLNWKNSFLFKGDEVYLKGYGKGNKPFEIKITRELYEEMQQLNQGHDKIFQISKRRVSDLMDRLRTKMNIDESRMITFHSIRKAYGTLYYKLTQDIEATRKALRHESIATTQIYLGINNNDLNDIIFSVDKIQDDLYKKVNNDDLLVAIENLPKSVKLVLNLKVQEILNNK